MHTIVRSINLQEYSERDFFHELGYILHHIGNNCDWWKNSKIDLFDDAKLLQTNFKNNEFQKSY